MINVEKPTILNAIKSSLLSLLHPKIIFHMLWPVVLGFMLWVLLYFGLWILLKPSISPYVNEFQQELPNWLINIGVASILLIILQILLAILLMPVIYLTFVIIISAFSIPLTLPTIINKDYPKLEAKESLGFIESLKVTLIASLVFLFFYIVSFALFFIPFAIIIAHLICTAFLNKSTFLIDALSTHATIEECERIKEKFATPLFFLGLLNAVLTYLPIINIFAPALAALCFIHYGLSALEFIRAEDLEIRKRLEHEVIELTSN